MEVFVLDSCKPCELHNCQIIWVIKCPVHFVPHNTGDAYNTEERTVVAGYDNGDIKMFDLKKMAIRWETNVKNGVREILCMT